MCVIRDTQISRNSQFNHCHKQYRQSKGFFHYHDDNEDCSHGNRSDDLEVAVGAGNQVLCARCFTDEHPTLIIFFQHCIQLINLIVHLV